MLDDKKAVDNHSSAECKVRMGVNIVMEPYGDIKERLDRSLGKTNTLLHIFAVRI